MKAIVLSMMAGVFIWVRCILDTSPDLTQYIGILNSIALTYVLLDIIQKVRRSKIESLKTAKYVMQKKRERVKNINALCGLIGTVAIGLSIVYITKWTSGKFNDILSIVALALSLVSDEIVDMLTVKRSSGVAV